MHILFILFTFASTLLSAHSPKIELSAPTSLIDEPLFISISGLEPFASAQLRIEALDAHQRRWSSHFDLNADGEGYISFEDPMQLFCALHVETDQVFEYRIPKEGMRIELNLLVGGQSFAKAHCHRLAVAPGVQRIPVRANGIVGTLFLPPSDEKLPCVITLTGSNGGLSENRAQLLASHGFAAFALGYFAVEGLPAVLENIPLEYFERAFEWLRHHPKIDAKRIGLYGVSRGAELSLILGTVFPDSIQALVATVPSSVISGGMGVQQKPAWIYRGEPVGPDLGLDPHLVLKEYKGRTASNLVETSAFFLKAIEDEKIREASSIPVEKLKCPLLLISAGDDKMWPSGVFAKHIEERLARKKSPISCTHLHYEGAGHKIGLPYLPVSGAAYYHPAVQLWFSMGGTPEADEFASRDSWKKLLAFFKEKL